MKKIIFVLSFFLILYIPHIVHAEKSIEIIDEMLDIPQTTEFDASQTAKLAAEGKTDITFSGIFEKILNLFTENIRKNYSTIFKITAAGIISGIAANLSDTKNDIGRITCVAAVGVLSLNAYTFAAKTAEETCDTLFLFVQSIVPSVAATSLAVGHTAESASCGLVFCAMQIFIHICKEVIFPLIAVITALGTVDNLGEKQYLSGVISLLKKVLSWGTGLMLTLYGGVVTLQTQTAGAFDSLAGKTVKFAVGNFVPIVGGALSESLDVVLQSTKVIKSALGVSGIVGVCFLCAGPLINLCSVAMSYKIASGIVSVTADSRVSAVINEIGGGIFKICINVTAVSIMFILSIAMLCRFGGVV